MSRRALPLQRASTARKPGAPSWRERLQRPDVRLELAVRVGFLAAVLAVLWGSWTVAQAHLAEQFRAATEIDVALIDPNAEERALTPENIERRILAFNLRLREDELYLPAGTDPRPRPFTIIPGEPARFVAARLEAQGFIRDAELFNLYLRVTGLDRRLAAGNFMLAETMTVPEIAEALQEARFEEILVTIPEGFRAEEIAERLAENYVIDGERFLTAVRNPRTLALFRDYEFLRDLPEGASLEGYLFPDTYRFPVNAASPEVVLRPFLENFEAKVGLEGLRGGSSGLSGRDLLTLASIVEREAVQADERPLIAGVYLNRLNGTCADEVGGNFLQADPTVQYARGEPGNWWWKPERVEDYLQVVSPYNTYLHPGLPPGPIANPGLNAIQATRNPAQTAYCFFLATGEDGRHVFAETLAEHQRNLQIYGYRP